MRMGALGLLQRNQQSIQNWADTISKAAQVLALVLAGFWTYKTFYESEKPSLEPRLNTTSQAAFEPIPTEKDACDATLRVTIENSGKRAVDVNSVNITGWISDRRSLEGETPHFITNQELEHGQKFFDRSVESLLLKGHFPPGASTTDAFVWTFRNQPDKIVLWRIDLQTSKPVHFGTTTYFWDYVCRYR